MEFWEIYDQYYVKVRGFILAVVRDPWRADDLIQETFLRVQQNLETLRDSSKLSSWIFRIAYNLCQDHFRQGKAGRRKESTSLEQTEGLEEGFIQEVLIQKELEQREMGRCVQDQIELLPEPLRAVLVLFDIMECSHQEIADILGITVASVKVRLHRARKKLKPILEEKCTFERDERNVLVCTPVDHGPKDDQLDRGQETTRNILKAKRRKKMEKGFASIMSEFMKGISENDKKKMMACGEKMAAMYSCTKMKEMSEEEKKAMMEKMMSSCGGKMEKMSSFFKKMGSQPGGTEKGEKA